MSQASNYLEEAILNYFFRNQAVAQPTTIYLALYINDPTDADTGTEVSGGGYSRKQVTFGAPAQTGTNASSRITQRLNLILLPLTGVVYLIGVVRTAVSGGSLLCRGSFSRVENVQSGNRLTIEIGNLQISME